MHVESDSRQSNTVLTLSTIAFTLMFAVWLMFGVLGKIICKKLAMSPFLRPMAASMELYFCMHQLPYSIHSWKTFTFIL